MSEDYDASNYTSMSIATFGPCTIQTEHKKLSIERNPIDCSDIEGTKPFDKYSTIVNKPDLYYPADIPGSSSKRLHKDVNYRDTSLCIDDIEGARARIRDKFHLTKRRVDPLNPDYPLPSYQPAQHYEPKFLRDSINVSDIEGATSTTKKVFATRDTMQTGDIVGAQACYRPRNA